MKTKTNKKIISILILVLLLNIFLISVIRAEDASLPPAPPSPEGTPAGTPNPSIPFTEINPETGLPAATEKVQEFGDAISSGQWSNQNNSYLRQELTKILEQNEYTAWIIKGYRFIYPYIAPFFKYTVGMNPEWSWLFIISFVIWCAFLVGFYRTAGLISSKTIIRALLALVGIIAIGSLPLYLKISDKGVPALLGNYIATFVSAYLWWVQLLLAVIIMAVIILIVALPKYAVQVKEASDEKKEREDLKQTAERDKTFFDTFSKGIGK